MVWLVGCTLASLSSVLERVVIWILKTTMWRTGDPENHMLNEIYNIEKGKFIKKIWE